MEESSGVHGYQESVWNADAVNTSDCVPLDNSILTQRGWLKYDEVCSWGHDAWYNFDTGFNEWTRITNVVHHENSLVTHLPIHDGKPL